MNMIHKALLLLATGGSTSSNFSFQFLFFHPAFFFYSLISYNIINLPLLTLEHVSSTLCNTEYHLKNLKTCCIYSTEQSTQTHSFSRQISVSVVQFCCLCGFCQWLTEKNSFQTRLKLSLFSICRCTQAMTSWRGAVRSFLWGLVSRCGWWSLTISVETRNGVWWRRVAREATSPPTTLPSSPLWSPHPPSLIASSE